MCRLLKYSILFFWIAVLVPGQAFAGDAVDTVRLKIGEKVTYVDGIPEEQPVAPFIHKGETMISLRFMARVLGAEYTWDRTRQEAEFRTGDVSLSLRAGSKQVKVKGTNIECRAAPVIKDGTLLVPLRVFTGVFHYKMSYQAGTKTINLEHFVPNKRPVADFTLSRTAVAQGETVYYEDESYDPDGDELLERKWTGKKEAFFAPGEHEVVLQVKDENGQWSKPCTKVIRVTEEVKMNRLPYYLHNPVSGEPLDLPGYDVLGFKTINPVLLTDRDKVMISNSPEKITRSGILSSAVLNGENRVYYHHINDTDREKKVFVVAENKGEEPVKLEVKKRATAGPADPMAVGRAGVYRYLDYNLRAPEVWELSPGEVVVLNKGQGSMAKPGKAVHGIFDINAAGNLSFSVLAVDNRETVSSYKELPVRPGDGIHLRGTFSRANRNLLVQVKGNEPSRLAVGDGEDDHFLYGKYGELLRRNKGNYGVDYKITIRAEQRVGVLFSPRGGVFAGAGKWNGQTFYLPNRGVLMPKTDYALAGVIEAGKEKVLEFMPPAGSSLPVNLIFFPFYF